MLPFELQGMKPEEFRARRPIAQRLVPAFKLVTPLDAARWMLATQAQQYDSGVKALQARANADNFDGIVRCWSQRGTHHFLAAEDAPWMMRSCAPRAEAAAAKRRPGLGITSSDYARAKAAFHEALSSGPVPRKLAYEIMGFDGAQGSHLLRSFGSTGDVVQIDKDVFAFSGPGLDLEGDDALAELGTRYFHSRGPATVQDLAWWSGLTVRDAKRAASLARDVIQVGEHCMGAYQENVSLDGVLGNQLDLPAFDEYLLGYKDRSVVCPAELVPIVGPTKNGMCRPFRVVDGEVAVVG
ncbi:winged helix DNA-binding domain-containing protein [Corynebacterium hindlerae]|uniref:Winged helix DNA-binding domain-containing protein n=1 Tax=Corynebacterium hindlerae TaxID=699041 RepID=A0A7G5FC39_9CORY|nr:crosslink repair DNA glycosylase YcaQ family protein [Corynebacterium hindlerae]QMV84180.1 winged helix DNA-binding domain-containing protein [Corynebacterium hindlerae]